jgi:hydroxymethylbilane synthase
MKARLTLGSRASALAVRQAELARDALRAHIPDAQIAIKTYTTSGDAYLAGNLSEIGNKGLFTKEIEVALLAKEIDIAVHSMKDVATILPQGLIIPCMLPRDDVRDVLLVREGVAATTLDTLPHGITLGTSSLRRAVQVRYMRPDIHVVNYRGNVQRRLEKLQAGEVDATLLAKAGLDRLGLSLQGAVAITTHAMLPAVAQGAIGLQCRADDWRTIELLESINDDATHSCVSVERHMLHLLDGSCRTPIAGYASLTDGDITLTGLLAAPDASWLRQHTLTAPRHAGRELAEEMARLLRKNN